MRKYLIGLIALFALVVAIPVNAQVTYYEGNSLMKLCTSQLTTYEGKVDLSICFGFLMGVASTDTSLSDINAINAFGCITDKTNVEQLHQAFLNYMNAHPEHWQLTASTLVLSAYANTSPCTE